MGYGKLIRSFYLRKNRVVWFPVVGQALAMNDEQRWSDVLTRNPNADGTFWCGVLTTRIYCHPSCPSRRAKKENVRFYESPEAARRDGLRPCNRCRPDA